MRIFFANKNVRSALQAFTVVFSALLFLSAGTGCSNEAKNEVAVLGISSPMPLNAFAQATGYLPALYLERADFLQLDSLIKYRDKLVLQLQQPATASSFKLSVYAITDKEKLEKNVEKLADKNRIRFPKPFANALNIAGKKMKFVNQRTKEDEFPTLLSEVKKFSLVKYIIFEPEIEDDHIRFKITGVEKLPFDLLAHGFATKSYYSRSF